MNNLMSLIDQRLALFRKTFYIKEDTDTFAGNVAAPTIEEFLRESMEAVAKENEQYFAYCECGDALERTGLYPNEAIYYCSGCEKTYGFKLIAQKRLPSEDIRIQECTCQCHQTHSNYHDSNVGRCCNNPDAFEPSNEDTKDCKYIENGEYCTTHRCFKEDCTPTDTDAKEGKSFFDLPEQEKREIVEQAAKDSNAAQRDLVDASMSIPNTKSCICIDYNGLVVHEDDCYLYIPDPVGTTQLSKTNPKLESNQENSLNDRKSSVSTTDTWAEEFDNDFPEDAADISKMNPAMWNMARTEMKQFIRKTVEADRQRIADKIEYELKPPTPGDEFQNGLYSGFLNCKGKVLEILQDKGEDEK